MSLITPKEFYSSFFDIDFLKYKKDGFNIIFLDIDNTLAPYNNLLLNDSQKDFINKVIKMGFIIYLFSNNTKTNVKHLAETLNTKYFGHVYKPFPFGYRKLIKRDNLDINRIICIGDQLLTDVLGANYMHLYSIYVDPLTLIDKPITFFSRSFERFVFKFIFKRKHRFNKGYVK